jgi:hypothetical protein
MTYIIAEPCIDIKDAAIGAQAEGAVRSHARRALAVNMTSDEVRHVGLLALTTLASRTRWQGWGGSTR